MQWALNELGGKKWKKVEKSTLNSTLQSLFLISKQPSRRGETDRPCHICLVARSINHTFPLHSTLDRITFRPQKKNPASNIGRKTWKNFFLSITGAEARRCPTDQ